MLEFQNPNKGSEYYLNTLAPINRTYICSIIQNDNLFLILSTGSKSTKIGELQFYTPLNQYFLNPVNKVIICKIIKSV